MSTFVAPKYGYTTYSQTHNISRSVFMRAWSGVMSWVTGNEPPKFIEVYSAWTFKGDTLVRSIHPESPVNGDLRVTVIPKAGSGPKLLLATMALQIRNSLSTNLIIHAEDTLRLDARVMLGDLEATRVTLCIGASAMDSDA